MLIGRITYSVTQWLLFTPNCQNCTILLCLRPNISAHTWNSTPWLNSTGKIRQFAWLTTVQEIKQTQN